jgi:hypothetical protein
MLNSSLTQAGAAQYWLDQMSLDPRDNPYQTPRTKRPVASRARRRSAALDIGALLGLLLHLLFAAGALSFLFSGRGAQVRGGALLLGISILGAGTCFMIAKVNVSRRPVAWLLFVLALALCPVSGAFLVRIFGLDLPRQTTDQTSFVTEDPTCGRVTLD